MTTIATHHPYDPEGWAPRNLSAKIRGDRVVFSGGQYGEQSVPLAYGLARSTDHWLAYCAANNADDAAPINSAAWKAATK